MKLQNWKREREKLLYKGSSKCIIQQHSRKTEPCIIQQAREEIIAIFILTGGKELSYRIGKERETTGHTFIGSGKCIISQPRGKTKIQTTKTPEHCLS